MTSILNKPVPWGERRHTTDHTARSTSTANTPSVSRSSSVASNASHRSEPSWFNAYNGQDTSRKGSSATTASQTSTEAPKHKSSFSSWLTDDPKVRKEMKQQKEAERKRKNDERRKSIDKLVITSKHAAAVKMKLANNSRRGSNDSDNLLAPRPSAHITASQQEMRFPHSGPPALHGGHREKAGKHEADMPALTRIQSGDERDDEDDRRREEWIRQKRPDLRMRALSEGQIPSDEEEELADTLSHTVLGVQGTPVVGVELEGDKYTPRPYKERHGKPGYERDANGSWHKPKGDGFNILHQA